MRRHKKLRDNIEGVKDSQLKRLAYMAEIERVSISAFTTVKDILVVFLDDVLKRSITFLEHKGQKTLNEQDVLLGLEKYMKFYPSGGKVSKCEKYKTSKKKSGSRRRKSGSSSKRKMKFYRKNSGCVHIAALSFRRLVIETSRSYKAYMKFTKHAIDILHEAAESYLLDILEAGKIIMDVASRKTLHSTDLVAVLKIRKISHVKKE